jgi:predicted metal-dependent hydrolase
MGVSFRRLSVRGQKTRWGSCSGRGTLSFNWRLVAAPRAVIEYIAVHELAHVRHRNHSKAFWAEVAGYLPEYKEQERWLGKNKHALKARTSFG